MDKTVARRSNEQQRAATGSNGQLSGVAPAGRGRWRRAWPGERRRPWRGLCSMGAVRGPKGGPGSFLRPLGTVIAARLASAQQHAAGGTWIAGIGTDGDEQRPVKHELRVWVVRQVSGPRAERRPLAKAGGPGHSD